MSKISKDKRDKIVLVGIGTVAAVVAIWFSLIGLQRKVLDDAQKRKIEAQQQVAKGTATLKGAKQIDEDLEKLSVKVKGCETAMAAPNDMYSWLIQTLNTFRAGYNVEIPQYSRETPAEVGIFPKFPYRAAVFSVRGTAYFHDFGKFLSDFENRFPYIRVQNIELESAGDVPGTANSREKLTFRMDLLTLVRPIAQ
jgi:hypothetical protein